VKKSPFSRTAAHIFVSSGDAPATITQYVAWMERQFNACQTPRSMYLSIFDSFRVIQCVSPKIAIFTTFLFPPGDAPEAITLNVVWMEREFDAYKFSRCMCPSTYNHMWDRARYLWKNRNFIISLAFDAPVRGVPVGMSAPLLVWKNYNGVATRWWKNFEDMFIRFDVINERDGQADRQSDTAWQQRPRLCIASHRTVKMNIKIVQNKLWKRLSINNEKLSIS